jgi:hypothetical protein
MHARIERLAGVSAARAVKGVLIAQVIVAGFVLLTDMGRHVSLSFAPPADLPTGPVSPGDQVRLYEPARPAPRFVDPTERPDMPAPREVPERLAFEVRDVEGLGAAVVVAGAIMPGDAGRFTAYLESLPEAPAWVALDSPGGIVVEGLAIGREIRTREMNATVLPGTICLSSCPYALAGGVERRVSREGAVGLHQHFYDTPGYIPVFFAVEDIQAGQGQVMTHFIEMGVDPGVMVHGLMTPPEEIYVLVEEELAESRLATEVVD